MSSAPTEAFRPLLNRMAPGLKAEGFLRRGSSFVKDVGRNQIVIEFQRWPDITEGKYSFYVNLGYISQVIYWFEHGRSSLPPRATEFHWMERLGEIIPDRTDWGWFIEREDEADRLPEGFLELLRDYGLPLLEQHSSDEALVEPFKKALASGSGGDLRPLLRSSVLAASQRNDTLKEEAVSVLLSQNEDSPWGDTIKAHVEKLSHWNW